jgi:hypothetical protein
LGKITVIPSCGSSFTITSNAIPVSVDYPAQTITSSIGATMTLAIAQNITLYNKAVGGNWSTTTPSLASLGSSGTNWSSVTGLAGGSALITYTVTNLCGLLQQQPLSQSHLFRLYWLGLMLVVQ